MIDPNDLSIEFYGPQEDWLEDDVSRYRLNEVVTINCPISREESIEKQRHSHMLLLLMWNNPEEIGVYTGKVFDYLAAGSSILSIGIMSESVVEALLKNTGAGINVSSPVDIRG